MKPFFALIIVLLVFSACNKTEESIKSNPEALIGNWIVPEYNDSTTTFTRANSLMVDDYGISFQNYGKLLERKNAGWCGTPPITYADYEGNWSGNDSIININVSYWGGTAKLKWKIISLDNDHLTVIWLEQIYEQK